MSKPHAGGLILLYHRVAAPETDPQLLAVNPQRFDEHLDVLRRVAAPMRLSELVQAGHENRLPPRAVAITFDDGYADNLFHARPLLAREGIPATVFVATGYLDGTREFWWDALERILLQPGQLPSELNLMLEAKPFLHVLNGAACYHEARYQQLRSWSVLSPQAAGARQQLYLDLCSLLRPLSEDDRNAAMHALAAWSRVPTQPRADQRPLRHDEIAGLAQDGLIEVGAHTVTHPVLSSQPLNVQSDEINESKRHLEELLGASVQHFSYPYGTRRDYTAATTQLAREAGFELAVSNFRGTVTASTDSFQLPRLVIRDWDGDTFERRLMEEWSRE